MRLFLSLLLTIAISSCSTPGPVKDEALCADHPTQGNASEMHWSNFEVQTAHNFGVQGVASGRFLVAGSVICFAVDKVALSTKETSSKPFRISAVKLGLGQNLAGEGQWKLLGISEPHGVNAEAPLKGSLALAPFDTRMIKPADLPPGAFVVMEIMLSIAGDSREALVPAQETQRSSDARMNSQ
ncbi:MAG TPA: hypothetical protein VK130_03755 [Steroidobacteraceae bacterium]|nr:hypothetical protein [Steroidobacteraceae bacterium]